MSSKIKKVTKKKSDDNKKNKEQITSNVSKITHQGIIQSNWVGLVVIILALMTFLTTYYLIKADTLSAEVSQLKTALNSQENSTQDEASIILEKVSKHILLKDTKDPLLAEIADVDKVKEQNPVFYQDAQNGDKLLIVDNKAIIYRPSTDTIINIAPVTNQQTSDSNDSTKDENVSLNGVMISIYNGTDNVKAIDSFSDKLNKSFVDFSIKDKEVAPADYAVSIVYDVTADGSGKSLADKFGFAYSKEKPANINTDAKVVIILGTDKF